MVRGLSGGKRGGVAGEEVKINPRNQTRFLGWKVTRCPPPRLDLTGGQEGMNSRW